MEPERQQDVATGAAQDEAGEDDGHVERLLLLL